jgi:hypothetical protein
MNRVASIGPVMVAASLISFQAAAAPVVIVRPWTEFASLQPVQYHWRGHDYCWYQAGWHGPGWYRCGFATREGLGWGGPAGWHRWSSASRSDRRRGSGADFQPAPTPRNLGAVGTTTTNSPLLGLSANPQVAPLGTTTGSGGPSNSPTGSRPLSATRSTAPGTQSGRGTSAGSSGGSSGSSGSGGM